MEFRNKQERCYTGKVIIVKCRVLQEELCRNSENIDWVGFWKAALRRCMAPPSKRGSLFSSHDAVQIVTSHTCPGARFPS